MVTREMVRTIIYHVYGTTTFIAPVSSVVLKVHVLKHKKNVFVDLLCVSDKIISQAYVS